MRRIGQPRQGQRLVYPLPERLAAQTEDFADEGQQFAPAHPAVVLRRLVEEADATVEGSATGGDIHTGNCRAAAIREGKPGEQPQRRRLARAIWAEKTEDRASWHVEREMIERQHVAVALGEVFAGDCADHG